MNSLDRSIRRDRNRKLRRLKKLMRARDMASKHLKRTVRLSEVNSYFGEWDITTNTTADLAKRMVYENKRIQFGIPYNRPQPPLTQKLKEKKRLENKILEKKSTP